MPNGGIVVDYATINQAADDCTKTGAELDARFEELESRLAPLTESWTGNAQDMWIERQQQWNQALAELKQVLAQIATALPQIADGYQETDTAVGKMFG